MEELDRMQTLLDRTRRHVVERNALQQVAGEMGQRPTHRPSVLTSESGERGSVAASTGIAMGARGYPVMSGWETTPEPISASTPYPRETRLEGNIEDSSYLWSGLPYPQVSSVQSLVTQTTSVYTIGRPLLSTGLVSGPPTSQGGTTRWDVQDMDVTATHGRIWLPTSLPSRGSQGLSQASVTGSDERLRNVDRSPVGRYTTGQSRIIQPAVSQPIPPQATQWSHQGPSPRISQQCTPTSLANHANQGISSLDQRRGDPSHYRPPVPSPIGLPMTSSSTGTRGILRNIGGNAAPLGNYQTVRIQDSPTARLPSSMPTPYNIPISHSNPGQDSGGDLWNRASGSGISNSQVTSRSKPKRVSNYDGKSSWNDYLVQFQIAARLNHWSEEEKAMELATSLVGQARGVLSDMSEHDRLDYGALVQKLSLRFEPVDLVGMYQSQLRSRKRKHNESLPELAQEIGKLTRQAFPTADETTRNYMAVTSFISALGNEQQELFVYQRDPKTVEEAGKAAMAFETFQAARPGKTPFLRMQCGQPPSTDGHQSDQDDSIKQLLERMTLLEQGQMPSAGSTGQPMSSPQLTELVNRIEKLEKAQWRRTFSGQQAPGQRSGNRSSGRRPGNCHYCGIPGHWQNECQKRQRDQARGTAPLESGQPQLSVEGASVHPPTTSGQASGNSQ